MVATSSPAMGFFHLQRYYFISSTLHILLGGLLGTHNKWWWISFEASEDNKRWRWGWCLLAAPRSRRRQREPVSGPATTLKHLMLRSHDREPKKHRMKQARLFLLLTFNHLFALLLWRFVGCRLHHRSFWRKAQSFFFLFSFCDVGDVNP